MKFRLIESSNWFDSKREAWREIKEYYEGLKDSKVFTKPFIDAVKSKFNIDMTGKSSDEFTWTKPYTNSKIVVSIGRNSLGNYYITCHYEDDDYNFVNGTVDDKEIGKFKKILSKI